MFCEREDLQSTTGSTETLLAEAPEESRIGTVLKTRSVGGHKAMSALRSYRKFCSPASTISKTTYIGISAPRRTVHSDHIPC